MNDFHQLSFDNILLAGNSASQAAPDTGYGLIPALDNGVLAAKVAAEAVKKGRYGREFLMKYDIIWSRKYKLKYRFNRILQLAHYHLPPEGVSRMVESFKASTLWLVKKTKSSLSPGDMDWFFRQMGANFPLAKAIRNLPFPAVLMLAKEFALLKIGIYAGKLMPAGNDANL
jgi:flavin-dependent dehydrogenase